VILSIPFQQEYLKNLFFILLIAWTSSLKSQQLIADIPIIMTNDSSSASNISAIDSTIEILWDSIIAPRLDTALWQKGSAYDAGHFFMVPLHAAFQLQQPDWQIQFAEHFKKFSIEGFADAEPTRLYRLQYYYLASWFLVLAVQQKKDSLIPPNLFTVIQDEVDLIWNIETSWTWKHGLIPFKHFDNMRSRILWKLYNVDMQPKTFYRAIVDEEKFVFAIAANLKTYLKLTEADTMPANDVIDDVMLQANVVWQRRVEWNEDGGWLYQPGYWTDHVDFLYAGNNDKSNPKKAPVENIAEDVSHSHRTALWLKSFYNASDSAEKEFYGKLIAGLDTQFFNKVLVNPSDSINTYLTNNFMDGNNGLYRWNFKENQPNTGFGPYELSGTMLLGWWTFLETERIKNVYSELSQRFPIAENILAVYEARTGLPRPENRKENHYTNGFDLLICKLAALLK
jgi:hypothetical protein